MRTNNGMYIRIEKSAHIDFPEGMTYEEALEYGRQQDAAGNLEFDLFIDVMYEDGEIANEAGYTEVIGVPV